MSEPPVHVENQSPRRGLWKKILKWTLFAIVLFFAGRYGYRQWQRVDFSQIQWSPWWFLLSGVIYMLSWLPASLIWWRLLNAAGDRVPAWPAIRAHFCGHVGKYVPGKMLALVIRAGLLKAWGVRGPMAAVQGIIETLLTMATGLLLFVACLPLLLGMDQPEELAKLLPPLKHFMTLSLQTQGFVSLGILLLAVLVTPVFAWLLNRLMKRLSRRKIFAAVQKGAPVPQPVPLTSQLLLICGGLSAIGWLLNGLSVGCLLAGLGLRWESSSDLILWVAAVAGATSLGFIVLFAPGGLGVREAVMVAILQLSPQIDASLAVVIAVLLRLVTFLSELIIAGIFYTLPTHPRPHLDTETGRTAVPATEKKSSPSVRR